MDSLSSTRTTSTSAPNGTRSRRGQLQYAPTQCSWASAAVHTWPSGSCSKRCRIIGTAGYSKVTPLFCGYGPGAASSSAERREVIGRGGTSTATTTVRGGGLACQLTVEVEVEGHVEDVVGGARDVAVV